MFGLLIIIFPTFLKFFIFLLRGPFESAKHAKSPTV